jgi:hypothetical protein
MVFNINNCNIKSLIIFQTKKIPTQNTASNFGFNNKKENFHNYKERSS